jgi:thiol-disulfide isomerase/thioredoxin
MSGQQLLRKRVASSERRKSTHMRLKLLIVVVTLGVVALGAQTSDLVTAVRAATGAGNFAQAERLVAEHRTARGTTTENILAVSWLARGAMAEKRFEAAERFAGQARTEARAALKGRPVDSDPFTPGAIGNAIDVLAHAAVERGARSEAVSFLTTQMRTYRGTSIEKRIQKTLHVYTLEGKTAPALDLSESIGTRPPALSALKGKTVLLFFWAHWCSDCKAQSPILATLYAKYRDRGLVLVAPTQRFGYAAGGAPTTPADEKAYIERIRAEYYPVLAGVPMPLSAANHLRYGVSSTPTLTLVDRDGIVRLYHPGRMTEEALEAAIQRTLAPNTSAKASTTAVSTSVMGTR